MTDRRKVLIACCNGSGKIHKSVVLVFMRMQQDPRHKLSFIFPTHSPYVQNLHKTVNDFLKRGDDFLLIMDDDNAPTNNPLDLVELDKDVIGLPTPVWRNERPGDRPYCLNVLSEVRLPPSGRIAGFSPLDVDPKFVPKGLQQCDVVGTGCILIARRVLVELMKRAQGDPMETPFMRKWNDQGEVIMGNDYAFCTRARAAGFSIWAHFDYICQHFNELELGEMVRAMMGMRLR